MMKNITMSIDENLLKKAKKAAIDKNSTLTAMIRKYLEHLSETEENKKQQVISELKSIYNNTKIEIGKINWKREDIHER